MTNGEILNKVSSLSRLLDNCTVAFPAQISYKIIRNYKILQDLESSILEARDQLIRQMYEPVPESLGTFQPKPGFEAQAQENMNQLYGVENEINLQTFKFEEISDINLSLEDMDAIYFMIKED